jgi:dipeptidyl aminopeptidase/acylaminoacyl peptidase
MTRTLLLGLICATSATPAPAADPKPFAIEDLVALERISDPAVAPDARAVAYTVTATDLDANRRRSDLWLLDLNVRDARPRQLTSHPENDSYPVWSSNGDSLYFLSTRSGSNQIWRLSMQGGEARQVTDLPVEVGTFALAPGEGRLAFTARVFADCEDFACTQQRLEETRSSAATGLAYDRLFVRHWDEWGDGRTSQLFTVALTDRMPDGDPVSISGSLDADVPSRPFGDAQEYAFSPDGSRLVFSARIRGNTEPWSTNFDLFETAADGSGEPANLTAGNRAWDTGPVFSPDGRQLVWRAMSRPGFEADRFAVRVRELADGSERELAAEWDRSPNALAFAPDGKTLYATADHFGQHPLWAIDLKTGRTRMLTGPGHVESFSVTKERVVVAISSLTSPAELFAVGPKNDELTQLTRANARRLDQRKLGRPEQFTFRGAGDATIYGYVVAPAGFNASHKYPAAFIVHGGPQGSFGNAWSYRWNPQTYAGAGYAVVFVDFHGSTGYGQAFTDAISGDWGGKPLEDLRKGLAAALERYSWIDGDRVCALGASYGGYMINWIAGHDADPFRCLVNHAGLFDMVSMYYSTEELWFPEWEFGGPAYEVPENYQRFNPANAVDAWQTPMLVTHGLKDFRVPYTQGLSTFTALQRRGIPSRLVVFPDENHWILKPANSIEWHHEVERWLARWLMDRNKQP